MILIPYIFQLKGILMKFKSGTYTGVLRVIKFYYWRFCMHCSPIGITPFAQCVLQTKRTVLWIIVTWKLWNNMLLGDSFLQKQLFWWFYFFANGVMAAWLRVIFYQKPSLFKKNKTILHQKLIHLFETILLNLNFAEYQGRILRV